MVHIWILQLHKPCREQVIETVQLWSGKELALGGNVNVTVGKRLDNRSISVCGKDDFVILAIDLSVTYLKLKLNYYSKVLVY